MNSTLASVLAAGGDPIENIKSWILALLVGVLWIAVVIGLVKAGFRFTPMAIIGAIILGALVISSPVLIPMVATKVQDVSTNGPGVTTAPWMQSGDLFGTPTTATATTR